MTQVQTARRMPAWASATLIVLALATGAAVVYWFFTTGPAGADTVILDRGPQDGIKGTPGGRMWNVTSGNTKMQISKGPGDTLQAKFGYLQYDFLTPEEFEVLNKGRRIAVDGAMAEAIGLSSTQTDQLRDQVRARSTSRSPTPSRKTSSNCSAPGVTRPATAGNCRCCMPWTRPATRRLPRPGRPPPTPLPASTKLSATSSGKNSMKCRNER